jgi:flagellar hook-basal body complex protein FliE
MPIQLNTLNPPFSDTPGNLTGLGQKSNSSFGNFVKDAISSVEQNQLAAEKEISRAVSGQSPDLHQTMIALQSADLKFQFGLQVRNKLINAYDEIMRMQV